MIDKILNIVRELNPYDNVEIDTQLLDEGILDSLTLVILIEEIEGEFGISIPENMLQPELFETVSKIEQLIKNLS